MKEDAARRIELVRAVELEDRDATLLTREDRRQADAHARSMSSRFKGKKAQERFLAERADFAASRLTTRHKGLADLLQRSRWPAWLGVAVPLVALAAGLLASEFGTGKRLDLLAVPLLGTILWNVAVYLAILFSAPFKKRESDPFTRALVWLGSLGRRDETQGTAIDRAAAAFRARWTAATAPLAVARASRSLHLGAALFALGLIGGIYIRALVIEYRAGWESTFLGPEAVHTLLSAVLGPASAVTGVAIPPLEEIAAMRWTGAETGGVNAGPWIHLYTATVIGIVVIPRLLLALWQGLKGWRIAHNFPHAGREDFYVRRLLRASGAAPGRARVTPYAYTPGEETRRRLTDALRAVLGDGAQVRFDDPVAYGAEDNWGDTASFDPEDDYHLLFFSLSATPEDENHGVIAGQLATREGQRGKGTIVGALVDESPYRAHFAGQAGLDERVETRLEAWRKVLGDAGLYPLGVDLSQAPDGSLAERIEANLIPDSELR